MLYVMESRKTVQQIEKDFPDVAAGNKFGILGVHDLRKKMNEKGVPFDRDCLVFEICNPQQAKSVLEGDMSISTALPCRVSVYQDGGKTKIATLKPTALLGLFSNAALNSVAEDVERRIIQIIKELA